MRRQADHSGVLGAVGLSVGAHLLLLVVALWLPLGPLGYRFAMVQKPQERENLTVSFNIEPLRAQPRQESSIEPPAQRGPTTVEKSPAPASSPASRSPAVPPASPENTEDGRGDSATAVDPATDGTPVNTDGPPRQLDLNRAFEQFGRRLESGSQEDIAKAPRDRGFGDGFAPDLSGLPPTGTSLRNLQFESTDYDWNDYGRQIYVAIWRAWHNRLWATTDEFERWAHDNRRWHLGHRTRVRFVIESNGQIKEIAVESLSGCEPLDASAVDALSEVVLPPLPADFARSREVVHAWFLAEGEILKMRPALNYYKSKGLF